MLHAKALLIHCYDLHVALPSLGGDYVMPFLLSSEFNLKEKIYISGKIMDFVEPKYQHHVPYWNREYNLNVYLKNNWMEECSNIERVKFTDDYKFCIPIWRIWFKLSCCFPHPFGQILWPTQLYYFTGAKSYLLHI